MSDHTNVIIWVMKIFFVQFFCVFFPPPLIASHSVSSIPFLPFFMPIFAWDVPLISLIFLKRSLVFPILLFSSVSLHCSLRKAFLSLLAILRKSAFIWEYLSFLLCLSCLFFSQLFALPPQPFCHLVFLFLGSGFYHCLLCSVRNLQP